MSSREHPPQWLVKPELLRPTDLDDAVHRPANRDPAHACRDIVGCHWLEQDGWNADYPVVGGRVGDARDELEELGCVDDRERDRRRPDQLFLGELRPEVAGRRGIGIAALGQRRRADNRQGDVMPDACGSLGGENVAGRCSEKLEGCRVLEVWRVRHVDDD